MEPRKLAFWHKVRWVAGDVKELNHLVKTLRQYNTELAEILPPSRFHSFKRRVEREHTTSPNLSRRLAASVTAPRSRSE